jgi:hypothetical protein
MARGLRFGRKPKLTAHQIAETIKRREVGEALTEIGPEVTAKERGRLEHLSSLT